MNHADHFPRINPRCPSCAVLMYGALMRGGGKVDPDAVYDPNFVPQYGPDVLDDDDQ